jgi:hypothetical protein
MDHKVPLVVDIPGMERIVIGDAIVNDSGYVIAEILTDIGKELLKPDLTHLSIGFRDEKYIGDPIVKNAYELCACYSRAGITYKHKCPLHRSVNQ